MSLSQQLLAFFLLLAYFVLHSVLATDAVKSWFASQSGTKDRYYRLIYNAISTVLLLPLLGWMMGWQGEFLLETNVWTRGAALLVLIPGAWISIGALRQYDLGEFSGIQQWQQKHPAPRHSSLNTTGFNALVRHPLYLGLILLLIGIFLAYPRVSNLILLASVLVYLPFGIHLEEKKLRRQFGQAYWAYQQRVKCLIPGIW